MHVNLTINWKLSISDYSVGGRRNYFTNSLPPTCSWVKIFMNSPFVSYSFKHNGSNRTNNFTLENAVVPILTDLLTAYH